MAAKIEPGTYPCKTTAATIYEAPSGAVMCRIALDIGLTGGICLIQKDGTLSERGFKDVQAILGLSAWDWAAWEAEPESWAGHDIEAVVETVQGERGDFSSVKYLNVPGGAGRMEKADAKALAAKYGAKTRALFGGTPAKPTAPKPPPAAPKAPPPPPTPAIKPSTMEECWQGFCTEEGNAGKPEPELYGAWHERVEKITGKKQNDCTPEDWGRVRASLNVLL